ncbi:MAG: hypothetical protein IJN65_05445 [Clostridia bacterium]|nr:hypothetical protein [Clostridia bacterium]
MSFCISKDGVNFTLECDSLTKNGDLYELNIKGNVPVPSLIKGDRLLLPIDEGVALSADGEYEKADLDFNNLSSPFCNREATMGMFIIERDNKFLLIAIKDCANSAYSLTKKGGLFSLSVTNAEPVSVYYGVFDNLLSACKAYRNIKNPNAIPLSEKLKNNPNIENLIGGGIFWIWNDNYDEVMYSPNNTFLSAATGEDLLKVCGELKTNGINKAMIGIFFEKDSKYVEPIYKNFGYIATQYDNYNDCLNPALLDLVPSNRARNCDYTARRMKDYPQGVRRDKNGNPVNAWALKGFDGKMYNQNQLCPAVARDRMKTEVAEILKQYPYYKGRFIDVYGTSLADCFDENHPITLKECICVKSQAFNNLTDMGLIAGTEDGFDDIIDSLVYSEGMHSPAPFRIINSGRRHANMFNETEQAFAQKQMLNPALRVPLWQMVYHECLITYSYWGDSTDDSVKQVDDKILFACLFGCPPIYSFSMSDFETVKPLIIKSYKKISEVHSKVALLPITEYTVLKDDYSLQTTVFGNEYRVVANFANEPAEYLGTTIAPKDILFIKIQKAE